MSRLTFPEDRSAFRAPTRDNLPIRSAKDALITVYLDAGASQLAMDLLTVEGVPITTGVLHVSAYSQIPLFQGPNDGRDVLYVVIDGGPVTPIYARVDDRIDALATQVAALTSSTTSNLSAEAAARAAADSAEASARAAADTAEAAARASAVATEAAARVAADATDDTDDTAEVAARTAAVAAEATARTAADNAETALRAALDAREAANNAAQATAIGDETAARAAAVSAEASARIAADAALTASITANTTAIGLRLIAVDHGATAGTARPTSSLPVKWFGTVAPTNAVTNDEWYDRTTDLLKRYNGTTWVPVGTGTYSKVGSLGRFHQKYGTAPGTAKIVLIGDSTTDATTAPSLLNRLKFLHTQRGEALDGMATANIISQGNNGQTLLDYLLGASSSGPIKYSDLVAAAPDLVIACWGLNDVRLGQCSQATLVARLTTLVNQIRTDLPNADIVLRIPNTMLTTADATPLVKEADGTTTASAATVQAYSTLLRDAYLQLENVWPNVVIADVQANVTGVKALVSNPLLANQLHPTNTGGSAGSVPTSGGYVAIADYLAEVIGVKRNPFPPSLQAYQTRRDFIVVAGGSTFLDLTWLNAVDPDAAQFPLTQADVLFVPGFAGPIALTSATITRPFGGTNIRIANLTGKDFTSYVGSRATLVANHPGPTTNDRQIVSVDLPSIAAGAFGTVTVTVSKARTGALQDATAVLCTPPATFEAAGLYLVACYPSANDTVRLIVWNPTAGAVDLAAANFAFWVVR